MFTQLLPSNDRGMHNRVQPKKLLLALTSFVILGFKSHGTHDDLLLSHVCGSLQTTALAVKGNVNLSPYRPWRPLGLWEVEARTFSRHLAHRWRKGCQPYAPAAFNPQEDSWYSFLLEAGSTLGPWCGWKDWVN
jgi:hypothetical protein